VRERARPVSVPTAGSVDVSCYYCFIFIIVVIVERCTQ
jgi:hypothetical protein